MKPVLMVLWGLLTFLLVEVCIFIPLYFVGLPVALLAQRFAPQRTVASRLFPDRQIVAYAWAWLDWWVGNYEDGIRHDGYTAIKWFIKNPVTNLRFAPIISTRPSPDTHWVGNVNEIPADGVPGWFLVWAHGYVGFRWQCSTWGVWLGWKVNPRDSREVPADDYRRWGIGTAAQRLHFSKV